MTKTDKKSTIRKQIIEAANVYGNFLAGKRFLYVYGNDYFEVSFPSDHFLHLTGVATTLSARAFYKNARQSTLSNNQFFFDNRHSHYNVKKKLPCLKRLPELTNQMVCILKDLNTLTITYDLSVTNLEFTLGLTQKQRKGNECTESYYVPMTLRVRDKSVEKSGGGEIVDFIFSKDACQNQYTDLLVKDSSTQLPFSIKHLIDSKFYES